MSESPNSPLIGDGYTHLGTVTIENEREQLLDLSHGLSSLRETMDTQEDYEMATGLDHIIWGPLRRTPTMSALTAWRKPTSFDFLVKEISSTPIRQSEEQASVCWRNFNHLVSLVIILNAILIGLEVNFGETYYLQMGEQVFCLFFVGEIVARIWVQGSSTWFLDGWNVFDFVLVLTGVLDVLFVSLYGKAGALSFLTVARVMRLLRLFHLSNRLSVLVTAFAKALSASMMIFLVIFIIDYIFAVILTVQIGHKAADFGEHAEQVERWFGDILSSMRTMLIVMTLCEWDQIIYVLMEKYHPGVGVFLAFFFYIGVTAYTLMSLVTGVICEALNLEQRELERRDLELARQAVKRQTRDVVQRVEMILTDLDADNSGTLTCAEVLQAFNKHSDVLTKLRTLQIDLRPQELYELIGRLADGDHENGSVKVKDVVHAMSHLTGNAKAYAVYDLQHNQVTMRKDLTDLRKLQEKEGGALRQEMKELRGDVEGIKKSVDEIRDLLRAMKPVDGAR